MIKMKTKEVGKIYNSKRIIANGIQFLNGSNVIRCSTIPIMLIDYKTPESAKPFAKGKRFKFWIKLEEAKYKWFEKQINPNLKEISIWFTEQQTSNLLDFLILIKKDSLWKKFI